MGGTEVKGSAESRGWERRDGGTEEREGRERGSPVTLQGLVEYNQPPRGSDPLVGCDSPTTGSAAVVQQVCLFNI